MYAPSTIIPHSQFQGCNNVDSGLIESIKRFYMEQDSLHFFTPER